MKELYQLINYKSGFPFIFSRFIREYDIKKANISILYNRGIISKDKYYELYNAPRMKRQIYIGNLERSNPSIVKELQDGIIEVKRNLFLSNNLGYDDILAIKNDAVYVIDKILSNTIFDGIEFVPKNIYTSYMNITNIEFYYFYDKVHNSEKLDIKGLGKYKPYHDEYMTDFIMFIMNQIQTESIESVISDFNNFYKAFQEKQLPIQYYREYNSDSYYSIINSSFKLFEMANDESSLKAVDPSYNINILRIIYQYITSIYFNQNR